MTRGKVKQHVLLLIFFISGSFIYGLDAVLAEEDILYFAAYEENLHNIGYRIFRLNTATKKLEKTVYMGGMATIYDSPRKMILREGDLYFLDGRKNPNTPHQGMLLRYDLDEDVVRPVSAFEADDYAMTEDGIWIIHGGQLCQVRTFTIISMNLYKGKVLRRLESYDDGLCILEDLSDGESLLSFFNTDTGESVELAKGAIGDFTIHENKLYYFNLKSSELMEIGLNHEGYGDEPVMILQGVSSIPKFDNYGYFYFTGIDGKLWTYVRSDGLLMEMTDGPVLNWQPMDDYLYIAREYELPFHFLLDMKTGNHVPVSALKEVDND